MKSQIVEECSVCLKELTFLTDEERQEAMNAYIGEIMCDSCKAVVDRDG
jgi:very-short-patch-repair endonuclease